MNWKTVIILVIILLLLINILLLIKLKIKENFDNIALTIGNEMSLYFYYLGLSIINKEDFNYTYGINNKDMKDYFFFNSLPNFIKYDHDDIYNCLISNNISYENLAAPYSLWELNDDKTYYFWVCMKPLVHKILDETFQKVGLKKEVNNPIIHFRCADTPFNKWFGYHFQYYSFFKEALDQIYIKTNKKYNYVDIMSCSFHESNEKTQKSCKIYSESLQNYLKEIGYESNIICDSNIDDFATLFYAPAVISTSSSFSFMSGFFGNGIFISTEFNEGKLCKSCKDVVIYEKNLMHNLVDDYNDTDNVIRLLNN
jgi:peroxiredoxin family protein